MGSFEELKIRVTLGDVARAAGDLVMSAVRHLPETGYPSSRQVAEPEPFVQQSLPYDSEGNWVNLVVPSVDGRDL